MTKTSKATRCLLAARDIIAKAGAELDPMTLQWAQDILNGNATRQRASPNGSRIMALYEEDPFVALTRKEVIDGSGLEPDKVDQASLLLRKKGKLFRLALGRGEKPLYFASDAAMRARQADARRAAMDRSEDRVRRRLETHEKKAAQQAVEKPLKIPRLATTPPPRPKKVPPEHPPKMRRAVDLTPRKMPALIVRKDAPKARRGEAIIPPGLKVQQCPAFVDTRYIVTEPIRDGFLDEWKKKRGEQP